MTGQSIVALVFLPESPDNHEMHRITYAAPLRRWLRHYTASTPHHTYPVMSVVIPPALFPLPHHIALRIVLANPRTTREHQIALEQLGFSTERASSLAKETTRRGIPHVESASFIAIVRSLMTSTADQQKLETAADPTPNMLKNNPPIKVRHELLKLGVPGETVLNFERTIQKGLLVDLFSFLSGHLSYSSVPVDTFHLCAVDEMTEEVTARITGLKEMVTELDE